jgi:hypothetical protein
MTRKNATNDNDFSHQRNNDKERTMYFQEQKHILINFNHFNHFDHFNHFNHSNHFDHFDQLSKRFSSLNVC